MNINVSYMKLTISTKKIVTALTVMLVVLGAFQFNTSTEVRNILSPQSAEAADFTCDITTDATRVIAGSSFDISWTTTGYATVRINGESVTLNGTRTINNIQVNTTYTLTASSADGNTNCQTSILVFCIPIPPPTCTLTPTTRTIMNGESVLLTWTTTNVAGVTLSDFGIVPYQGSQNTGPLTAGKTYTLAVTGTDGSIVNCISTINVDPVNSTPLPVCTAFTATPATITRGSSATLNWATANATRVVIDNGVGPMALNGTVSVTPLATLEFTLTAFDVRNQQAVCRTTVTVNPPPTDPVPRCVSFIATPSTLPVGGGSTLLTWTTANASGVSISPTIGLSSANGAMTVNVSTTTVYTLTANGASGQTASCPVIVTVNTIVTPPPTVLTCQANVSFSTNAASIVRGNDAVLSWSTSGGITRVSFDQGITATGLSGSTTVSPQASTRYILTATSATSTVSCLLDLTVTEPSTNGGGGGGGGSSSPRCELSVSKNKISGGESITLRWDSTRASDIKITDNAKKTIVTTTGLPSREKSELFAGTKKVSPTKDTTYTLTVERGKRDTVCTVKVAVTDEVEFTELRDQQPLIAGIALTEVPYTGFEAGPIMTVAFYALLAAWALFIAYILVIRRDMIGGYKLATAEAHIMVPEYIRPDVFVASVRAPSIPPSVSAPLNLPVAESAVIGYASLTGHAVVPTAEVTHHADDEEVTTLENYAHAKKALLSSDSIRHFIATTKAGEERIATLNEVITLARGKYPSEDGWVVINEKRMQELCATCQVNAEVAVQRQDPYIPTTIPAGSGSLAEAIVTGNIVAAYEMIGHRPMFALADAASDLDSIYRNRKGGTAIVSDLLKEVTAQLSDEQVRAMIEALTGALDGVYTDEASAVKMAIMKAVKVVV